MEIKVMEIFQFAKEKEKYSEDFYRQLAEKTDNKGLKNICKMLADEEVKHYKIIQSMQNDIIEELNETSVINESQKIFESMKDSAEKFNFGISELELYEIARDFEQKSKEFYDEKSEEAENSNHKKIFKKLAAEEQKHYLLMDRICVFVARPQWFLENAEMYRFDDYAGGVL